MAIEQFSIDGNLFLAYANYKSDSDGYNTDSFIYKLNDSTGKFSLYQSINTSAGRDVKHFTIGDKHYLAVNNRNNGVTSQLNSTIYQWNGHKFVFFQNITTVGGTSFNFFEISSESFLAVTNTDLNNLIIYKWKSNHFEKFQELETELSKASTAFAINNETFIVFANYKSAQEGYSVKSPVFKWSGRSFVEFQSLQTYGAWDVKSFKDNGDTFLAFANQFSGSHFNIDSSIYKWDGSKFISFHFISTRGARAWHPFIICGQTFLGVANSRDDSQKYSTHSVVYRFSGEQLIKYQEFSTQGANDIMSFEYRGHTYLATANFIDNDGKRNLNSTLYKRT